MEIYKSMSPRRGNPIKSVAGADGHNYYVLSSEGSSAVASVRYVQYYSSLEQFEPKAYGDQYPTGFYWVRDAASSGADHYGDSSVHAGWAMYIWDPDAYQQGVMHSGWVKVAEQGDVDWDIGDELKAQFVLKTVYNQRVNTVDERFKVDEALLKKALSFIENFDPRITEIEASIHTHHNIGEDGKDNGENLSVLNRMSERFNTLYYRGRPISGNSYIYDNIHDNKIWWKDPTDETATETEALNSAEIADKFATTEMARIGMTLFVLEIDGSVSVFKIYRKRRVEEWGYITTDTEVANLPEHAEYTRIDADGQSTTVTRQTVINALENGRLNEYTWRYDVYVETKAAKFEQNAVEINEGVAEYVETLPAASQYYAGRGCWVPLKSDGIHIVNHLHKCILKTNIRDVDVGEQFLADLPDTKVAYLVREENVALKTLTADDYGSVIYYDGSNAVIGSVLNTSGVNVDLDVHPVTGDKRDGRVFKMVMVSDLVIERLKNSDAVAEIFYRVVAKDSDQLKRHITDGKFTNGNLVLINDKRFVEHYEWRDISNSQEVYSTVGGTITACWAEDLGNLWNTVSLVWEDPEDTVEKGITLKWAQTKVVRKFGSAPKDENDGEVIKVSTIKNECKESAFVCVCPYSNEDVYFRLFSKTVTGGAYIASEAVKAEPLNWATITKCLARGAAPAMFKIHSTIVLPRHSLFGNIECEVIAINKDAGGADRNGILIAAKNIVCDRPIDCSEVLTGRKYAKTTDTSRVLGKTYYNKTGTSTYVVEIPKTGAYSDKNVNPAAKGLYETNPEYIADSGLYYGLGSNGEVVYSDDGSKSIGHVLNTLNVMAWLNSETPANWYYRTTVFDTIDYTCYTDTYTSSAGSITVPEHNWASESGFLGGFEDHSIFSKLFSVDTVKLHDGSTDPDYPYSTFIHNCKVILPHPELTGYDVIMENPFKPALSDTLSNASDWSTLAADEFLKDSSRPHVNFKGVDTLENGTTVVGQLPADVAYGILPIFFIGADV